MVGAMETISPRRRNKIMRRETGAEPEHTAFPGVTQRELEPGVHRLRGQVPSPRGAKSCLVPTGGGSEGEAFLDCVELPPAPSSLGHTKCLLGLW